MRHKVIYMHYADMAAFISFAAHVATPIITADATNNPSTEDHAGCTARFHFSRRIYHFAPAGR